MPKLEDSWRHKGMRKRLVDTLKEKGIYDRRVLEVMNKVPRHFFMDSAFDAIAYEDRAFPIAAEQTISQPYTVAYQTQMLNIQAHDKVLEIGTGSGYQTVVLSEMGASVFTIERQRKLFDLLKQSFVRRQYPFVKFFYGDGYKGIPTYAPFDKIIVTAAAPYIPQPLIDQLKVNGIMIIPVGGEEGQRMFKVIKNEDGSVDQEAFDSFSFVPMLEGKSK